MARNPLVSVVIPTLNSARTIEMCLHSITRQSYQEIEVIVVDGGSSDGTSDIAKELGATVVDGRGLSMSAATNIGACSSNGDFVYRVDSDVLLDESLVEEAVSKCESNDFDGVCVFWLPDPSLGFWSKVRFLEKDCYVRHPEYVGATRYDKNVLGARFIRRLVYDFVQGFDESTPTAGEDYAFYEKLARTKFKFALISSREHHIGEPRSVKDIVRKNIRYGASLKYHFHVDARQRLGQMSPFRKPLLIEWRQFARAPFLAVGFILYESLVYGSTFVGVVSSAMGTSQKPSHEPGVS